MTLCAFNGETRMKLSIFRNRLLAGAALGLGLAMAPTQAQADCVVSPPGTPVAGTVTCADTVTSDTTYTGTSPSIDRNYEVDTATTDFTGTVSTGEFVSGRGLAFTNTVGGAFDLNVVNNGTVQIDAGTAATAGGTAALNVTAIGATDVNYSGTGSVLNLGTGGNGLQFDMTGSGNLIANIGGNVTSAVTRIGILAQNTGTGATTVTTATDTTVRAHLIGIWILATNPADAAAQSLTNNATIASLTGAPGTLFFGVGMHHSGVGSITLVNNGTIGSATDRTGNSSIFGDIKN